MKPGDKIKMEGERQRYTVQACDKRYAILTKPFNPIRGYLYTITDLERGVRGRCNLIFGPPFKFNTAKGAAQGLRRLRAGDMEVSHRRNKALDASEIEQLSGRRAHPTE